MEHPVQVSLSVKWRLSSRHGRTSYRRAFSLVRFALHQGQSRAMRAPAGTTGDRRIISVRYSSGVAFSLSATSPMRGAVDKPMSKLALLV